jgi:nucleoside-diphosphate-sugar epimerase
MPTNLYGPGDNFHSDYSHVIPGLIRRFHEAHQNSSSEVVVWGTGAALREFLYVDDLADAAVFLMQHYYDPDIINVGSGTDISIDDLPVGPKRCWVPRVSVFDPARPDGTPRPDTPTAVQGVPNKPCGDSSTTLVPKTRMIPAARIVESPRRGRSDHAQC